MISNVRNYSLALIAALFLPSMSIAQTSAAVPLMKCKDLYIGYHESAVKELAEQVTVKPLAERPKQILKEQNPQFIAESPDNTAAFNRVLIANTMNSGPYHNVIDIFSTKGKSVAWRLEFHDLKDNVRLQWFNDDVIFIQIWLGRIVSTDLIFEISSGRFIYAKEANYGLLIEPCD